VPRISELIFFSNCVPALNAATGERIWHFQEIEHDIWDLDVPSPPNLVTIMPTPAWVGSP
jgi:glucose dehydrogenase